MRIGNGFDIHRLVEGRKLILGGVEIPHDKGVEGHSDGDALTHAVIDALLGASAQGNIGTWFSPTDPNIKGISSFEMLAAVVAKLGELNYSITNVDTVVICEKPKLSPHYEEMRRGLAGVLKIDIDQVSVKATTAERLGPIGQGEAIAVQAVALIEKSN
ncbi:MAG: 2-C-methyl-D-erythritol 2,4-cyclodiphosphate synthase [Candidatus Obscuribacterales bacterium]|nr:2-C-methyl-D-erythritol 2,4-cyclodiphosphate synthase [Candidatus Obscuribacterales bacterium]